MKIYESNEMDWKQKGWWHYLKNKIFSFTDNPVLCDAGLADLTVALEVNHAKVYGVANDCPTTTKTPTEVTSARPPLPQTLFHAAAAAASGGNVSFAATLE